jgi:hypothetical protein
LDFSRVHFYAGPTVDIGRVIAGISQVFPKCQIEVRKAVDLPANRARISDTRLPFEQQPKWQEDFDLYGRRVALYDGFELQQILASAVPEKESSADDVHIIFSDLLVCTFSEDDWRYHARTVICGTPSIISLPGIVEAPAKPKEFYFALNFGQDIESAKRAVAGRFIDYGDKRIADAATNFTLQALFYFLTHGEPFCDDNSCRLFNPHWQEDLIRTLKRSRLCELHMQIADKFNRRLAGMKSA